MRVEACAMHPRPQSRATPEGTTTAGCASTPGKGMGVVTPEALTAAATEVGVTEARAAACSRSANLWRPARGQKPNGEGQRYG